MTSIIRTERLTKTYGAHRGINEVDLEVAENEIFGFLGPNGAGKTTTLRMLATLLTPDAGGATIDGVDLVSAPGEVWHRGSRRLASAAVDPLRGPPPGSRRSHRRRPPAC